MLDNFQPDLAFGKKAEAIVLETFSALTTDYTFEDISSIRGFFYCGDIKATDKNGKVKYIEVKNDSRIADTKNVLCEFEVYYKDNEYYGKGNMDSNCDVFCVVSEQEQKIYVIDFKTLKANYTKGQYKEIEHKKQTTYCYLCELWQVKKWGALIAEVEYSGLHEARVAA